MLQRLRIFTALVREKPLTLFTALLLVSSSVYLTVRLCLALGGDSAWVLVAIGVSFELSKYLLSRERALPSFVMVAVLISGSIAASLGHLLQTDADRQLRSEHQLAEVRAQFDARERLIREIDGIERERNLIQTAAARDIESARYRTRGRIGLEKSDQLRKQSQKLRTELAGIPATPSPSILAKVGGEFDAIGSLFDIAGTRVRLVANLVVAVLLELLGVMMINRLRSSQSIATIATPRDQMTTKNRKDLSARRQMTTRRQRRDARTAKSARGDTGTNDHEFNSRFRELCERISRWPPRTPLRYRELCNELSVGHRVLRRYFEALQHQGVIRKEGRAWVRAA